jgi:hypothetical protein
MTVQMGPFSLQQALSLAYQYRPTGDDICFFEARYRLHQYLTLPEHPAILASQQGDMCLAIRTLQRQMEPATNR